MFAKYVVFVLACFSVTSEARRLKGEALHEMQMLPSIHQNLTFGLEGLEGRIRSCISHSPWHFIRGHIYDEPERDHDRTLVVTVPKEIRHRQDDPMLLHQKDQNFCGPVAFLHVLALSSPERFADMAEKLFCRGYWQDPYSNSLVDATKKKVKERLGVQDSIFDAPFGDIADIDWVLEASLRDSVNVWNAPVEKSYAQLTFPDAMEKWVKMIDAKVTRLSNYKRFVSNLLIGRVAPVKKRDFVTLTTTIAEYDGQAMAILLVDYMKMGVPNHWVVLQQVVFEPGYRQEPLENGGYDCWEMCGEKGGFCDACGRGNACCRADEKHDPPECKRAHFGIAEYHQCVRLAEGGVDAICVLKNWGGYERVRCDDLAAKTYFVLELEFTKQGRPGLTDKQARLVRKAWRRSEGHWADMF